MTFLGYLKAQAEKAKIVLKPASTTFVSHCRPTKEIDELEHKLGELEHRLGQMNSSQETLQKRLVELYELRYVLRESSSFFEKVNFRTEEFVDEEHVSPLLRTTASESSDVESNDAFARSIRQMNLGFITGVIGRKKMPIFERILWRSLRGNLYMNYAEIEEPIMDAISGENITKNAFIVFAHGNETRQKVRKICESLGATLYEIDEKSEKRKEASLQVLSRIEDVNNVLFNTNQAIKGELSVLAETLESWLLLVRKEMTIFHTLNQFNFDSNRKCLIAEAWCPSNSITQIGMVLHSASETVGGSVSSVLTEIKTSLNPPTYHRTNKFTVGFQEIVNAYGVAKYREVNPGLFTIITFPFLFAVMFGDIGHGFLMSLFAAWMVVKEKKLASFDGGELWSIPFSGRYIILLMGLFSIYTGLIYNDVFSKSISVFQSGFIKISENPLLTKAVKGVVYPFGIDHAWHGATNALIFLNSYKMKQAILFGIVQMLGGTILAGYNHVFFRNYVNIVCDTIPQILFSTAIFGYLGILIIYKWLVFLPNSPSLLNTMISMILGLGKVDEGQQIYSGQQAIQVVLLVIAFLCIPWMLLVKPYYLRYKHRKKLEAGYNVMSRKDSADSIQSHDGHGHGEEFNFSDIFVHQAIHTIEFALGSISNTASYLRLWALSLAHAQLSDVLWTMVIDKSRSAFYVLFVGYALWFSATVAILIAMEGLSAFLHALRLHWVEFNGKFYEGSGYRFEPLTFKNLLDNKSA